MLRLSEKVSRGLRKEGLRGKTITLKIRLEDFTTFTRAKTIKEPTNFTDVIYRECRKLFENFKLKGKKVRLIGVKVSNFAPSLKQLSFFAAPRERKEKLYQAVDLIKDKFGEDAIHLGNK